jgi:heptosyltransferase-1
MKVLLVKTSSIGDVIHTFPAVTDAAVAIPDISIDWVVEEALAPVPTWHPAVGGVIPVGFRRQRRQPLAGVLSGAFKKFRGELRRSRYDVVLDAQGLMKSAAIARLARGARHGLSMASIREKPAALTYRHRHAVPKELHAVERLRRLFAAALDYDSPADPPTYGIDTGRLPASAVDGNYLILLHGTQWVSKQWPVERWRAIVDRAASAGLAVVVPALGSTETERAKTIVDGFANASLLPKMDLAQIAGTIAAARGIIAVDTGLAHLAAALGVPCVTLYGPTSPLLTGTVGRNQTHVVSPDRVGPVADRTDKDKPSATMAGLDDGAVWHALSDIGGAR